MKLLTQKKQDDLLKVVSACQIIANHYIDDTEAYILISKNLATLSSLIGGYDGVLKVYATARSYYKGSDTDAQTPGECTDLQSGE